MQIPPSGLPLPTHPADTGVVQILHQVLEQTPAAVCLLRGPEHRFIYLNRAYQALFPGLALIGRSVAEALPAAMAQGFTALLDGVYRTGEPFFGYELPLTLVAPESGLAQTHYCTFTYQRFEENGQPAGISVLGTDVTELVLARQKGEALRDQQLATAERQAQERETSYQLFAQAPALILLVRQPGHCIEFFNAACQQQLFGGRALQGRDLVEALPEAAEAGLVALLDAVYRTGETDFNNEVPLVTAATADEPARTAYFNFTCQAYRENDQIVGVSVFAYDVTEQVLARAEATALHQRQQAVFEQAPVAIGVLAGPDYVVEVCNPGLQAIWRRTAAQALHRPLFEVLPEVRDQGFKELLDAVRTTGMPHVAREMRGEVLHAGQPTTVYLDFVYQPLRDDQGRVVAVAAVATDVSEQVAARQRVQGLNDELTAINQQLTRTNADLDTFVYTASHDLLTPVANIEGLLLALQDELPLAVRQTGVVLPLLDRMQGAVERFKLTIGQLTDVAKLQQGQALPAETVGLATLVDDLLLDLAPDLAASSAQLTVDVAACPQISFAPQHLRSIVFNLLSNAVKYRVPGRPPQVHLRCRSTATQVILAVEDNGLGLTEAQQGQLFGLFRRLHDHVEGSGLGLYMVKRLVENNGGTITVASQAGVGSTFTVTLPRPGSKSAEDQAQA